MEDFKRKAILDDLAGFFGSQRVAVKTLPDGKVAFRIDFVPLPPGCSPPDTTVLLQYGNESEPPQVLVKQGIKLKTGAIPRSTSALTVDGEPWISFSANFAYDSSRSVVQYVLGKLGRFARPD
jgi:hypothetical protein